MRTLLIRPDDALLDGPWAGSKWDRVVDLGRGGIHSYSEAASRLGSPISPLDQFRENYSEIRRTRELLGLGKSRLKDRLGLDWWALLSIEVHQQLETTILLENLAKTIVANDEVWVSGPGFHADALGLVLGRRIEVFPSSRSSRGIRHYLGTFQRFPLRQIVDIFWDKTDAGYGYRSFFTRKPSPQQKDVVLLPSAYVNVSRAGAAYAATVPDVNFLLVATRRSGWLRNLPSNVSAEWLISYASFRSPERKAEFADLVARWQILRKELEEIPEFRTISRCHTFEVFNYYFAHGLGVRDAWKNVLESEPVTTVLCADDSNPFTHIPLLLAKERGLRTISCHHGALDGRCMVKECHADVILAKGKMEQDYLTRLCAVPAGKVIVGAPFFARLPRGRSSEVGRPFVVFFSEPYETTGGRATDVYADLLLPLSDLAAKEGRQLIIKLHPAESASERKRIVERLLTAEQRKNVHFISEPLGPELLDKTWFGITVLSTVVMECALHGVPCFLCKWLESSPYGYVEQFVRFGLGIPLGHPQELPDIPVRLPAFEREMQAYEDCWEVASPDLLRALLSGPHETQENAAANPRQLKSAG
jgi:hypothetical protein